MAELQAIITIFKYLPDFIDLAKRIGTMVSDGVDYVRIQQAMKAIDKDFTVKDPRERAKRLNDEFRKV